MQLRRAMHIAPQLLKQHGQTCDALYDLYVSMSAFAWQCVKRNDMSTAQRVLMMLKEPWKRRGPVESHPQALEVVLGVCALLLMLLLAFSTRHLYAGVVPT